MGLLQVPFHSCRSWAHTDSLPQYPLWFLKMAQWLQTRDHEGSRNLVFPELLALLTTTAECTNVPVHRRPVESLAHSLCGIFPSQVPSWWDTSGPPQLLSFDYPWVRTSWLTTSPSLDSFFWSRSGLRLRYSARPGSWQPPLSHYLAFSATHFL